LEARNPAGSIKDRTAIYMIEQAERSGRLSQGQTLIESTSGNLGKSLALIGAARGYPVILVVDPKTPQSVINYVRVLGARVELVESPDEQGSYQRARLERVNELLLEVPNAFWPNQYGNPDNPKAHALHTATEILADVGDFDTLVASVSTGGHFTGLSSAIKAERPDLVALAVDALGSGALGVPFTGYAMRGLGLAWQPANLDRTLVDRVHFVADYEGIATCLIMARCEGILVGESAGAAIFAAIHHAMHVPSRRILVIAPDGGASYLENWLDDAWLQAHGGIAAKMADAGLLDLDGLLLGARSPARPAMEMSVLLKKLDSKLDLAPSSESTDAESDVVTDDD